MSSLLTFFALLLAAVIILLVPNLVEPYTQIYGPVTVFDSSKAVLLCSVLATLAGWLIYRSGSQGPFLLKLFLSALLLRVLIGTAIFVFNGQGFFGGDALTYDFYGYAQIQSWHGDRYYQ